MAKKQNNEMIAFLEKHIAQKEKMIIEHNGMVALDFDQLERYYSLRDRYIDKPKEDK